MYTWFKKKKERRESILPISIHKILSWIAFKVLLKTNEKFFFSPLWGKLQDSVDENKYKKVYIFLCFLVFTVLDNSQFAASNEQ